jgi:hypothetical protein
MSKNRRGGERTPKKPTAIPSAIPGAGAGMNRTDGGPADKQAIRRLPNAGYNENKAFVGGQKAVNGLPKEPESPQVNARPSETSGGLEALIFAGTDRPYENNTAGSILSGNPNRPPQLLADDYDILLETLVTQNPDNLMFKQLYNARQAQKP